MRFLIRLAPVPKDRDATLLALRGIAATLGCRAVNPKWTSHGLLEIDVLAPSREDFRVLMAALTPLCDVKLTKDLQEPPRFLPKEEAILESVALFNAERFWEAHEVLESLWRVEQGDEKRLLQGLILVCAALVHMQKGEGPVALGIARRALPLLVWREPTYHGLDVSRITEALGQMIEQGAITIFELSRRPEG
jgi:hypothetical protein